MDLPAVKLEKLAYKPKAFLEFVSLVSASGKNPLQHFFDNTVVSGVEDLPPDTKPNNLINEMLTARGVSH